MKTNPLPPSTLPQINADLRSLNDLKEHVDAAIEAGIPGADELQKRHQYCVDNLTKIKQVYFKGKR